MAKKMDGFPLSDLTEKIIGAAIEVHRNLGPGLLESVYETCLAYELGQLGLQFEQQKSLPIVYKQISMDHGYRIDLMVEDQVIVEIKTAEEFNDIHKAQILSYLKLSGCRVGLLINFNVKQLRDGLRRFII